MSVAVHHGGVRQQSYPLSHTTVVYSNGVTPCRTPRWCTASEFARACASPVAVHHRGVRQRSYSLPHTTVVYGNGISSCSRYTHCRTPPWCAARELGRCWWTLENLSIIYKFEEHMAQRFIKYTQLCDVLVSMFIDHPVTEIDSKEVLDVPSMIELVI